MFKILHTLCDPHFACGFCGSGFVVSRFRDTIMRPYFLLSYLLIFQLLDIVRANVASVLRRVWKRQDVVGLRLFRIFCRVFNRMLWNHGQGLINCLDSVKWVCWRSEFADCFIHSFCHMSIYKSYYHEKCWVQNMMTRMGTSLETALMKWVLC